MDRSLPCVLAVRANSPRYLQYVVLSTLFALGVPLPSGATTKSLRSPWDAKPITMTQASYVCPAIAHIAPDLVTDGFYRLDDPTHSDVLP